MGNSPSSSAERSAPERSAPENLVVGGAPVSFFRNKDNMVDAIKHVNNLPSNMHYSELPVAAVKALLGKFHPVHRVNLGIFRKVLECGSLQSRHLREEINIDPYAVLSIQISRDLTIRALMLRFVQAQGSAPIMDWLCGVARVKLAESRGEHAAKQMYVDQVVELNQRMRESQGWTGPVFWAKENKKTVVVASGAAAAVTLFLAGPAAAPLAAGLSGVAVGVVAALLVASFYEAERLVPGGGAAFLNQQRWDQASAMEDFLSTLRNRMDQGAINDDEELWLRAFDAHLKGEVERAKNVTQLLELLEERADQHVLNVAQYAPTGLGYAPDKEIGTDKHVFAILGPHFGTYYGDICIVLKQSLMYDPDFDVTPCAGTFPQRQCQGIQQLVGQRSV